MGDNTLLPCPFCGNLPAVDHDKNGWYIWCETNAGYTECDVSVCTSSFANKDDAIKAWNTRVDPEEMDA